MAAPGTTSGWHHHETNESIPTDEDSLAVIARVGGGIPTVNVDQAPPRQG